MLRFIRCFGYRMLNMGAKTMKVLAPMFSRRISLVMGWAKPTPAHPIVTD